jgi:hypothetical protein
VSRLPGRYEGHGLPIIRLEDSAFDESFKTSERIFDQSIGSIRELRTLVRIERGRKDMKDRTGFAFSLIVWKLFSHENAIPRTIGLSPTFAAPNGGARGLAGAASNALRCRSVPLQEVSDMTVSGFRGFAISCVAAAILAGCGVLRQPQEDMQPSSAMPPVSVGSKNAQIALSPFRPALPPPSYFARLGHGVNKTWMSAGAKSAKRLLYISDAETSSVFVYDYSTGAEVGDLTTDIDGPYGQCVDKKGDVYISDFDKSETVEYAHGGSTPIAEFSTSSGNPIGCAVDRQGDLAVATLYSVSGPGALYVWTHGESKPTKYQYGDACLNMYPPAYDDSGNVIVECVGYPSTGGAEGDWNTSIVCALLKGATSLTTLSFNQTIGFASGATWDGKYIALGDQMHDNLDETAIYQASLSGSTLTLEGTTVLQNTCGEYYAPVVQPFIVGEKNTPVNKKQGKTLIGVDRQCSANIIYWNYPTGGDPFKTATGPELPNGQSVSAAP